MGFGARPRADGGGVWVASARVGLPRSSPRPFSPRERFTSLIPLAPFSPRKQGGKGEGGGVGQISKPAAEAGGGWGWPPY